MTSQNSTLMRMLSVTEQISSTHRPCEALLVDSIWVKQQQSPLQLFRRRRFHHLHRGVLRKGPAKKLEPLGHLSRLAQVAPEQDTNPHKALPNGPATIGDRWGMWGIWGPLPRQSVQRLQRARGHETAQI